MLQPNPLQPYPRSDPRPDPQPYAAPWWLPGAQSQTIFPALRHPESAPAYARERWDALLHQGHADFIDVDWVNKAALADPGRPLLVLFHGLEGSSQSHYARAVMNAVARRGWVGAVPHFRGCSGEPNRAPRFYHSGDSAEIGWMLERFRREYGGANDARRPFYAAGVSLGGNALLRFLGEQGSAAGFVDATAAISAPLDLAAGGAALSQGFNMVYTRMFLKTLKRKCEIKLQQFPGLFDAQAMRSSRDLYEFDNVVTAPLHGYRDTDDYWRRASSLPILGEIRVPTLVLNARNDPFQPARALPRPQSTDGKGNGWIGQVRIEQPAHGGHVGFMRGALPLAGRIDWLPRRILDFAAGHG